MLNECDYTSLKIRTSVRKQVFILGSWYSCPLFLVFFTILAAAYMYLEVDVLLW